MSLPLADECSDCGRCCESIGFPPFEAANPDFGPQRVVTRFLSEAQVDDAVFDTELLSAMPPTLRLAHAEALMALVDDPSGQPCFWYDVPLKRCRHYEWRPATCRRFRDNESRCRDLVQNRDAKLVWQWQTTPERWRNPRMPWPHSTV